MNNANVAFHFSMITPYLFGVILFILWTALWYFKGFYDGMKPVSNIEKIAYRVNSMGHND
jgi:hypothetical protein